MWETFEKCKNTIKENNEVIISENNISSNELKEKISEITEKYLSVSTSKAKAECISYILKHARIDIIPDDIFALKINHCGIMKEFLSLMKSKKYFSDVKKGRSF